MIRKKIKINKWIAKTANRRQGTSSKSIKTGNKSIAQLSFKIQSNSPYWRAGFKLCLPNNSDLPLRDQNSLLFHVGAREEHDKMSLTVYINSEREKHERLEYTKNSEITIAFEVNEKNFITCLINNVQVFHKKVDSAIFKKIYLLAWGDSQDENFRQYEVIFKKITGTYRNTKQKIENNMNSLDMYKNKLLKPKIIGVVVVFFIIISAIVIFANNSFELADKLSNDTNNNSSSSAEKSDINIGDNNVLIGSLIAQNSPGATLEINEVKTIPYTNSWKIENKSWTEKWSERYNVLFILPNNKKAFLPKMKTDEEYIIAYTNEDCSDVYVSEAYQLPENFNENEICYTKKLFCGEEEKNKALSLFNEKVENLKTDKESFVTFIKNNSNSSTTLLTLFQKKQLSTLQKQELELYFELYEIIYYSPTEQSILRPAEQCIKLKNNNE